MPISTSSVTIKPEVSPALTSTTATTVATGSLNTSACPSVMPITPLFLLRQDGYSGQSTPSRSHAASCVTVTGDSDEDYLRTPIKQQQRAPVSAKSTNESLSRKNRLLAKAQSEWMLSTLKEESSNMSSPLTYSYGIPYSRNSAIIDEKDLLLHGYTSASALRQMSASRYVNITEVL